jgi:hypothetical protein
MPPWRTLGAVAPTSLASARQTLHHAAQLLALAGASYIEPEGDDSHTSMSWIPEQSAFATQPIPARAPFRIALRASDLTLLALHDASAEIGAHMSLDGRTRGDGLEWIRDECARAGLDAGRLRSVLHFTIERHPTDEGAPFQVEGDGALSELARWYANAALLLQERCVATPGAGPVRCWPHHFDIATLVRVPRPGHLQSIGIGLSPGDASYAEPYYYVAPYPPPGVTPAALEIGEWHTTSWWGAALPGSEITNLPEGAAQHALVMRFIDEAEARLHRVEGRAQSAEG